MWTIRIMAMSAATLVLAGCGGGNGDVGSASGEEGVRDVLAVLVTAVPDGDGPRVCSLLAPEAQNRLAAATQTGDCVAAVEAAAGSVHAADLADLAEAEVDASDDEASVAGPAAAALAEVMGDEKLSFVRLEEHWVVG